MIKRALLAILVCASPAFAQKAYLSIDTGLVPISNAERLSISVLASIDGGKPLKLERTGDEWKTTLDVAASSVRLDVRLDGNLPSGYTSKPLRIMIPYQSATQEVTVRIVAARTDGTAKEVVELFGRGFEVLRAKDLLAEYQRAAAIANGRRLRIGSNWTRLHAYDVQAVYKFLESAVFVRRKTAVVPDQDEIATSLQWLGDAYRANRDRVLRAIGDGLYSQIQRDAPTLLAAALTKPWNQIIKTASSGKRCDLLQAFNKDFAELGPGVHNGLTQAHILNAWSVCLDEGTATTNSVAASAALLRNMSFVTAQLENAATSVASDAALRARTLSHLASLREAMISVKKQCPECA